MYERFLMTLDNIAAGGIYMIPILAVSAVMFVLIVGQGCLLWRSHRTLNRIFQTRCLDNSSDCAVWRRFVAYYLAYCPNRQADEQTYFSQMIDTGLKQAMARAATRGFGLPKDVLICSALATLLGLLGTVSGMMNSFDAIQASGFSDVRSMAVGVSEALTTTQSGLMVGVVGVAAGKSLSMMSEKLRVRLAHLLFLAQNDDLKISGESK